VFLVCVLTIPTINRPVGITTLVILALAAAWWALVLRRRIRNGTAGMLGRATVSSDGVKVVTTPAAT
jgi:hypothetical protein